MIENGDRVRSPVLSPANDPGDFAAIAKKDPPDVWDVTRFYEEVTSPNSPLHPLISGDVRDLSHCLDPYRYLLMRVHFQNEGAPIVWFRVEHGNHLTIRFSTDRSKLQLRPHGDLMVTTFATLNLRPVLDLLHNVVTNAVLRPMWINTVIGILHGGFGGSWVKPPSPTLLKQTLNLIVMHAATIQSVQHQFAIQYPNAKKVTLAEPEAWRNEPAGLSQPPHPMRSPNMNGAVADVAVDAGNDGGDQPRGREIDPSNVLGLELLNRLGFLSRGVSTHQTTMRQIVQSAGPSSTPISNKAPTIMDKLMATLQRLITDFASVAASGQGSQTSPNLTGRIVRLGATPIATGGYSSVWRGTLLSLSTASDGPDKDLQIAIKVLRASGTDEEELEWKLRKRLHVEMRIWAQLHHENVVRLLGHTEEPEGPGLVSMLYPHGNVLGFLAKNPSVNREVICADVALGLQYLHEHMPPIIHGDLKGPNVLIDGEGRASICDFGLSVILDGSPTGRTSSNFGGSLRFLAPELLAETTRTVETDIYAYASTCIAILFDREPYHEREREAHLMRAILNHQPPFELSNEEATFPSFWRILKRCWDHDRGSRPPLNLIIDAIQRCLYRTYRTNMGIYQGIGRRVRFMCLPGIEEAQLISVADDGRSILVNSSNSFHRVPIYQRYRWKLMDRPSLQDSEDDTDVPWLSEADHQDFPSTSLSGTFASSSETPSYISKWKDYSEKFRLLYSVMVSYEPYNELTSETA